MDVLVAGHLAACIHQEAVEQRKFEAVREESRALQHLLGGPSQSEV